MENMYFNRENNFFHGIMFHHFHDKKSHSKSQGSISEDDLQRLIKFIGRKNILNAEIFYEKLKSGSLKKNEVCFTFDDGIKCQIDVALPVLEDQKIKAFFFAYSFPFIPILLKMDFSKLIIFANIFDRFLKSPESQTSPPFDSFITSAPSPLIIPIIGMPDDK